MPNLDQACSAILTHTLAPSVNFINVFKYKFFVRTSFRQLFLVTFWLCQKICTKNTRVKCWWNWHLGSFSFTDTHTHTHTPTHTHTQTHTGTHISEQNSAWSKFNFKHTHHLSPLSYSPIICWVTPTRPASLLLLMLLLMLLHI